ncbi:MAG: steroid delta-isomerase [Candidatus Heimdallarchaeota archaeon]|nr:steroid delta-isomerase [Candidatus Heimdallarchaeota archaeon]
MTIVDDQIEAYNSQDIENFLNCYSDDVQVYMLEQGKMITDGKGQLRTAMTSAFEAMPNSRTELISRITQGKLIVDHEKITGHEADKAILSIAIYEINDNKISKLWFGGRSIEEL